jgi:hypothetical protein
MRRLIMTAAAVLATLGPVLADGRLVRPHQAYPLPPPPQPSQSCLMTALQMGYLTGYGPYVPPGYFASPGWVRPLW